MLSDEFKLAHRSANTCLYTRVYACAWIHTYTPTHKHIHQKIITHTHTHTHTYTHTHK